MMVFMTASMRMGLFFGQWGLALMENRALYFTTTSQAKEGETTTNSLGLILQLKKCIPEHVSASTHWNHPISYVHLAKRQAKTTIFVRTLLHMTHSTIIRVPGHWACNLQYNYHLHAGC